MAATQLESIRIGGTKTSPSYHHHLKNAPESIPVLRHYPIQLTSLTLSSKPSLNPISPNPFKFIPTPKCDPETPYPSIAQLGTQKKTQNPIGLILNAIFNLKKPGTVAIFVSLLILCNPNSSWPATGGRMGGRSFSSGSSSRSSESSSSSFSRSSSSSSYSKPTKSSSSSSYSKPSRSSSSSSDSSSVGDGEMVYSESEMVSVEPRMGWNTWVSYSFGFLVFALVVKLLLNYLNESGLESKSSTTISSVIKLQVGLLGTARSLQRELNKIAESADTSAQLGLSYILRETALALLRHPDYCISACSSVDFLESIEEVEKRFDHLSIEEREKLDEETLVNVDNMKKKNVRSTETTEFSNEYLVVTILVAALGAWRLPTINSSQDLKKSLRELGSILSSKTLAVEVLWTPQDENDTLSERELLEKYALLRTLEDDDSLT